MNGRIKMHRIDCTHEAMIEPYAVAKIGSVLTTELAARNQEQTVEDTMSPRSMAPIDRPRTDVAFAAVTDVA